MYKYLWQRCVLLAFRAWDCARFDLVGPAHFYGLLGCAMGQDGLSVMKGRLPAVFARGKRLRLE